MCDRVSLKLKLKCDTGLHCMLVTTCLGGIIANYRQTSIHNTCISPYLSGYSSIFLYISICTHVYVCSAAKHPIVRRRLWPDVYKMYFIHVCLTPSLLRPKYYLHRPHRRRAFYEIIQQNNEQLILFYVLFLCFIKL